MVVRRAFTDPAERIWAVINDQDRRFQRAFQEGVRFIQNQNTLEEIASLLEQGRFDEALEGLDAAAALIASQYGTSYRTAADEAAAFLSTGLVATVAFDATNERAVAAIRANRLRLIREFTQQQRDVTRAALTAGITRGENPIQQARTFRDSIGLTTRQWRAVENYRSLLTAGRDGAPSTEALARALRDGRSDRSVRRAIRQGDMLSASQIDSMVSRYTRRYVKYRSEVIGRTEALRSVHQGTEEMYQQAIELGQFRSDQLERKWNSAQDMRVRDSHQNLNGMIRGLGETWPGQAGDLRYPGDPAAPAEETIQCRCALSTRIMPPSENRN